MKKLTIIIGADNEKIAEFIVDAASGDMDVEYVEKLSEAIIALLGNAAIAIQSDKKENTNKKGLH